MKSKKGLSVPKKPVYAKCTKKKKMTSFTHAVKKLLKVKIHTPNLAGEVKSKKKHYDRPLAFNLLYTTFFKYNDY